MRSLPSTVSTTERPAAVCYRYGACQYGWSVRASIDRVTSIRGADRRTWVIRLDTDCAPSGSAIVLDSRSRSAHEHRRVRSQSPVTTIVNEQPDGARDGLCRREPGGLRSHQQSLLWRRSFPGECVAEKAVGIRVIDWLAVLCVEWWRREERVVSVVVAFRIEPGLVRQSPNDGAGTNLSRSDTILVLQTPELVRNRLW